MAKQTINIGASPNDGTGTPLRTAFDYTNQNFTELYTALGGGTGLPGASTQLIFNDGGTNLAGDSGLTFNKTTDTLSTARITASGDAIVCSSTGDFYVGTTLSPQFKVERATGNATITGDLTVDTSTLKVDSANNRVGIVNATPAAALDILGGKDSTNVIVGAPLSTVGGGAFANYSELLFKNTSGSNSDACIRSYGNVWNTAGSQLAFFTANNSAVTERYRIDNTGVSTWSVAGTTAMTLNSTGLGVGVVPSALSGFGSTFRQKGVGAAGGIFTENNTGASWFGIYSGTSTSDAAAVMFTDGGSLRFAKTTAVGVTGFSTLLRLKSTGQLNFTPLAADPSGAEAGDVYYNSTSNKLKCYNGTTWNDLF